MADSLMPRLPRGVAVEAIEEMRGYDLEQITGRLPREDLDFEYAPLGGRKLELRDLSGIRREIVEIAREYGFPVAGNREQRLGFDKTVVPVMAKIEISAHEASHEEVWSALTVGLLLDVAVWRFPKRTTRRLLGQSRNVFRRLWWRAYVLDGAPEEPLDLMMEEEFFQLEERTTLFGNLPLAQALAAEYSKRLKDMSTKGQDVPRQEIWRNVVTRALRLTPFNLIGAVEGSMKPVVEELIDRAFNAVVEGRSDEIVETDQLTIPSI